MVRQQCSWYMTTTQVSAEGRLLVVMCSFVLGTAPLLGLELCGVLCCLFFRPFSVWWLWWFFDHCTHRQIFRKRMFPNTCTYCSPLPVSFSAAVAGAVTLEQAHVQPAQMPRGSQRSPATEDQMWSYLVQLCTALRAAHTAGLVFGAAALAPSKVLLTSPGRIRVGATGVQETLSAGEQQGPDDTPRHQRADLTAVGSLLLSLACLPRGAAPSLDFLAAHYSREFARVTAGLLAGGGGSGIATWRQLGAALGDRALEEVSASAARTDTLMAELEKECQNGRLARLLLKLGFVCERPELGGDAQWAETGDRYLVKLFRDFVFHQVDQSGSPVVDWGAAVEALNKADAGVPEQVLLLSRDESAMLVVSYADVRRCLSAAYGEVKAAGGQREGRSRGEQGGAEPQYPSSRGY
jgi:PAB-dependent poly(A)-specific ribonuclease subunit 3